MTNDQGRSHGWVGQIWKRRKVTMKSWSKGPRRSCNAIVVRRQFRDQATREKPSATGAAISTQKIKNGTEPGRQSILETCKGEICKAGWQARALQGEGPRVTLLPVVLQGDFPVWSISIAVGAGCLGLKGELVCALFAVDCFLRLQMKDQWTYPEVYRQSWTISIEGVCQDKWKGPLDGERQPLQAEYTHAGPALHKELQRHRRTWCAIAQEQEWQAESTFDLRFPEVRAPSKRQAVSGVSRPTCYLLCNDQTRYELQAVPVRLILLCHQTGGMSLPPRVPSRPSFYLVRNSSDKPTLSWHHYIENSWFDMPCFRSGMSSLSGFLLLLKAEASFGVPRRKRPGTANGVGSGMFGVWSTSSFQRPSPDVH